MNKSEIGTGNASIVLVYAVLCFTVFTLISYSAAENYMTLTEAEARLVKSYYEADTLAERVLSEILASDAIPASIHGVEIKTQWDDDLKAKTAEFSINVYEEKELYVNIVFYDESYDILSWRMRRTKEWQADDYLPVFIFN